MSIEIYVIIFALICIPVCLGLIVTFKSVKKKSSSDMSEDLLDQFIAYFGGKNNLVRAFVEGGRTKVTVTDTLICNFNKLKELGVTNIFISGNTIKMMCPFDTSKLVDYINQI